MSTPHRPIAVLNSPKHIPDYIKTNRNIVKSLQNNASRFPNLAAPVIRYSQNLDLLDLAETAAKNKTKGAAEQRNVCLKRVNADADFVLAGVQQVADDNPDEAEAIIQSAGLDVRKSITRSKTDFSVQQGEVSGSVKLVVRASRGRAAYEWQMTPDQKAWAMLPTTVIAKTTVSGLTPGQTYSFRYRVVNRAGEGEWSQIVSLLVT
jgi:hypothetical protein